MKQRKYIHPLANIACNRIVAFISLLTLFSAVCLATDKSITESYAKVQAAVLKKDSAAMKQIWLAYVDPSCVEERKGKKISYKQLTDQVDQQMKVIKKVNSCKIQVVSSKTKGSKTICTVLTTQSFVIAIEGKDSVFDEVSTVEDIWLRIKGKYKIVGIRAVKEVLKQDGKVISGA
jgi:hypothetical protein